MNPFRNLKNFHFTGFHFNLALLVLYLVVFPLIVSHVNLRLPGPLIGIFGLVFYVAEFWAFTYKIQISRARILVELTGNDPEKPATVQPLSWIVWYAFLMRFVFRIVIALFCFFAFGLADADSKLNGLGTAGMIIVVLFELFGLGYSWMETRAMAETKDKDYAEEELKWRRKYFPIATDEKNRPKEFAADLILLIMAMMISHSFWAMSNEAFMGYIDSSHSDGNGPLGVILLLFFANVALCLFMLVPVRLAYWVGESMQASDRRGRWKLRLSMFLAGLGIVAPVIKHFVQVYFSGV